MAATTPATLESHSSNPAPWWEILVVLVLSLGISLLSPSLKIISILIPVIYLIVEHRLRHRTWADTGFNIRTIPAGLLHNLGWVLLVGLGTQALTVFGAYYFLPDYFSHVMSRLPLDVSALSVGLIIALGISTLGEEIVYRALFQSRIGAFLTPAAAIGLSSLVFALMHYAPGSVLIVFIDLASVFIDSILYGVIFQRSRNVFISWIAHFLADIVGLALLLLLVR